jgi:hypothetical protein
MAAWLLATAQQVQLRKYSKHSRGPKKPTPARTHDPKKPPVSVALARATPTAEDDPTAGERLLMITHES